MPFPFLPVLSALGGLGSLFGGNSAQQSSNKLMGEQAKLTNLLTSQYAQNVPQMLEMLHGIARNPWTSPLFKAEENKAAGDVQSMWRSAIPLAMGSNRARGLGDSLFQKQDVANIISRGADALAQQRFGQLGAGEDRMWKAIQGILGTATPGAGTALSSLGQLSGQYQGQANQALSGLAQLAQLWAQSQYRPQYPTFPQSGGYAANVSNPIGGAGVAGGGTYYPGLNYTLPRLGY